MQHHDLRRGGRRRVAVGSQFVGFFILLTSGPSRWLVILASLLEEEEI
jgi:hypothetical protein